MSAAPELCPPPHVLEEHARGRDVSRAARAHIDVCAACHEALDRIREDNRFLDEFAMRDGFAAVSATQRGDAIEIPGYENLREIHRGGQGVVYRAVQRSTKRAVAIKVMRQGPFATLADRARFDREIEILGKLEHPNLVTVHDAGVAAGFHYFVMNHIDGLPLDEAFRPQSGSTVNATSTRERRGIARRRTRSDVLGSVAVVLRAFIKICEAVHAAHLRGVIHRDLKPSNIRVDANGEPFVLDFGLAKSADSQRDSAMTRTGQFVGSLPWASPEQVEGASSIDLRTDVYSLGAILYQLLTGAAPFDIGSNLHETLDNILNKDPPRPSSRNTTTGVATDDELDTIVLKCLSKTPERRYQTAGELARDLRRYLAGEPIEAKSDSALYTLRKTLRRHRLPVAVAAAFVVLLALFSIVMTVLYRHSSTLEQTARLSAISLSRLLSQSNIEQGRMSGMLGDLQQAEVFLWNELLTRRDPGEQAAPKLNDPPGPAEAYWALWELYRRNPCVRTLQPGVGRWRALTVANDGQSLWTSDMSGLIERIDFFGARRDSYRLGDGNIAMLPLIGASGEYALAPIGEVAYIWRRGIDDPILHSGTIDVIDLGIMSLSRNEELFAAARDGRVIVWRLDPPAEIAQFAVEGAELLTAALTNDAKQVAGVDRFGRLHVWEVSTGRQIAATDEILSRPELRLGGGSLRFSPNGLRLADAWPEISGRIWDISVSPPRFVELSERPAIHRELAFSPDSNLLAVGDLGGVLRIFDAATGERRLRLAAHTTHIINLEFMPSGNEIWTCGGGDLRLWEVDADRGARVIHVPNELLYSVECDPDNRTIFAGGRSGAMVRVSRDTEEITQETTSASEGAIAAIRVSRDGRWRVAATYANTALIWDLRSPERPPIRLSHSIRVSDASISPDGTRVATACDDGGVRLWRLDDGVMETELTGAIGRVPQIAFDPSGRHLAAALRNGALLVWDLETKACQTWLTPNPNPLRAVRYSNDGNWLLAAGADRTVDLWDTNQKRRVDAFAGHHQEIFCLDVSPNDEIVATGDSGGIIRLWDLRLRRPLANIDGHTGSVMGLRFSADGRVLVSASLDGTIRIWDLAYYSRHIAGNVAAQLRRVGATAIDPQRAAAWKKWADATMRGLSPEGPLRGADHLPGLSAPASSP